MLVSMTGYATGAGASDGWAWSWDLRAVNGRGLDLRFRLPDGIDGLEAALRARLRGRLARGTISCGLRLAPVRLEGAGEIDPEALDAVLAQIAAIGHRAAAQGLALAPCRATDILALKKPAADERLGPGPASEALRAALLAQFDAEIAPGLEAMRRREGAAIAELLGAQLERVADLVETAGRQAEVRRVPMDEALGAALARVASETRVDPDRLAQELAILATRTDVTEELDRLRAHVALARELMAGAGPVGRKLDFLMQEFSREANTLCSKSQDTALTRTGIDLKTTLDQMREQIQNVE